MVTQNVEREQLLRRDEAAEFLGVKSQTLAMWASKGRYQLPYVRVGGTVRYRLSDLQAFLAARTVTSSGQADALETAKAS